MKGYKVTANVLGHIVMVKLGVVRANSSKESWGWEQIILSGAREPGSPVKAVSLSAQTMTSQPFNP